MGRCLRLEHLTPYQSTLNRSVSPSPVSPSPVSPSPFLELLIFDHDFIIPGQIFVAVQPLDKSTLELITGATTFQFLN